MNKLEIQKQAKEILDKFAGALEKVEKIDEGSFVEREEFERSEIGGKDSEDSFKKRILDNAPQANDDFIITERGNWK